MCCFTSQLIYQGMFLYVFLCVCVIRLYLQRVASCSLNKLKFICMAALCQHSKLDYMCWCVIFVSADDVFIYDVSIRMV